MMGNLLNWNVVGLVYDVVGAIFLAMAIFCNSPGKIAHQAGTYWNSNPFAVNALAEQTVDARFGLIILVAGFVFQIIGQYHGADNTSAFVILLALLFGFVASHFLFLRKIFVRQLASRVNSYVNKTEETAK